MTDADTGSSSTPAHASRADALAVVQRLRDAGHVAYFAGGCVRDMLLGLEPKDYDVATDATPDRVRQLFSNTQAVGAAFGVILVRQRKSQIEVATFRSDVNYVDGRRPEKVVFTTAEEDAKRRDFTINGLFYDPIEDRVIDYAGGQQDLKSRVLRAIGEPDHRFEEDHLRLLRAVRFAARFGLAIEPATASAIRSHAEQLKRISPERVGDELRLMLAAPTRAAAWRLLWDLRLVQVIFRCFEGDRPASLDPRQDILTPLVPDDGVSFGCALAAVALSYRWAQAPADPEPFGLLDAGFIVVAGKALRQALKISNEELDELTGVLRDLRTLFSSHDVRVCTLKRLLAGPTALSTRQVLRAVQAIPQHDWRRVATVDARLNSLAKTDFAPPPLITGDDLTAAGLTPGPVFKRVLDHVYDAQLEDRVKTKDEAMGLALHLAREG